MLGWEVCSAAQRDCEVSDRRIGQLKLALEGARYGIRAVAISRPFLTPAADRDLGDNQAARDAITRKTLLKRFGQPEELVELAAFIASDRASYITGANYPVDGGATAW